MLVPEQNQKPSSTENSGPQSSNASGNQSFAVQSPSTSVPKGGGAIKGIDEKFSINPANGTANQTIPLPLSPGRSGFGPQLALSYNSGAGNGPFGFGWNLSLPSITRKTDKGLPQYSDEADTFILSGAEDLVPILEKNNGEWQRPYFLPRHLNGQQYKIERFRPRIEGLFARIERWTNEQNPADVRWRSISKDNITTWYGKTENSRIFNPEDESKIFSWLICESYDDKGNAILYKYKKENSENVPQTLNECNRTEESRTANRYLKRIEYGNKGPFNRDTELGNYDEGWLFETIFDYGDEIYREPEQLPSPEEHLYIEASFNTENTSPSKVRPDPFSSYRAGFEVRTYRRCQRVLMVHHFEDELGIPDSLVRSTNFDYEADNVASFITAVTQSGYIYDETKGEYLKKSLPPLQFEYSQVPQYEDLDQLPIETIDADSLENLPVGIGNGYQWVDLDGEGISGILTEQGGAWYYKPNLGNGRFGPLETIVSKPSLAVLNSGQQQLLDLAGDGQLDLAQFVPPTPGFYERTPDEDWITFRTFHSLPNLDWSDPNLRFVDLTGDGHADILITQDEVFIWHLSLAEEGFAANEKVPWSIDEEEGPRLVFADGTQSIYLADFSGDGLVDLARIRNGEICYWPNLGYGRFGAKVTMDNAPLFDSPDLFNQQRIRLADFDGSGTTDIVYQNGHTIDIYRNESGNSWSEKEELNQLGLIDNLSSVMVTDLKGNGTACLVKSSPLPRDASSPIAFIDLMGGQKPHLLTRVRNNLGAETVIHYAPSTKFYLEDKKDGRPWITKIPFPVHVVEKVETYDHISRNRFTTRYAYHHGYFDGIEREFRGFGMVEQWDTEELSAVSNSDTFATDENLDEASYVPPVHTKTWFHTGAYLDGERISQQFADEYYRESDASLGEAGLTEEQIAAMLLEDTILPQTILLPEAVRIGHSLSTQEAREACRALKGSILRQEVYALDSTEEADRPYTVSEQNYTIELLQPQGENQHAVFFAHPRESINFHYERKLFEIEERWLADPRVTHEMTLDVDEYGNVRQSVSISYGRRHQTDHPLLTEKDHNKQRDPLITFTNNTYSNHIDYPDEEHPDHPDAYRVPLLSETKTFELFGTRPDSAVPLVTNLFKFDVLKGKIAEVSDGTYDIPYTNYEYKDVPSGEMRRRLIEWVQTKFRADKLDKLLPIGVLEPLALPGEAYKLAFTKQLLEKLYNGRVTETMLYEGGYLPSDGNTLWWLPSGQIFYWPEEREDSEAELAYAQAHFYLPHRFQDPFGANTLVTYDDYQLLVIETRDPLGNRVTAGERASDGSIINGNNYRVLQPELITDPNGNRTAVSFDALGLVVGTAVMGGGDSLDNFNPNLTLMEIEAFFADPRGEADTYLANATTRIIYDVARYHRYQSLPEDQRPKDPPPTYAATIAREVHVDDNLPQKFQVSFSYSDGFGREIQKKVQAEKGPVPLRDDNTGKILVDSLNQPLMSEDEADLRWVGSGWTVFNNKGKTVRQYEPFFSDTHEFDDDCRVGVSPILFYDPVGRVVTTLHPNSSYEKVLFDPWQQASWDVNDTVSKKPKEKASDEADPDVYDFFRRLPDEAYTHSWYEWRTIPAKAEKRWPDVDPNTEEPFPENEAIRAREKTATEQTLLHADTPTLTFLDTLGRPFMTVADNGAQGKYATRSELDIEGNQRVVRDAKQDSARLPQGRKVMVYGYDLFGNRTWQSSIEAGARWSLANVAGNPIWQWDSREHIFHTEYDALQRPTHRWVRRQGQANVLVERLVYGENHPKVSRNLRGQLYKHFDSAGIVTHAQFDFKGNLKESSRQLTRQYKETVDWATIAVFSDLADLDQAVEGLMEPEIFVRQTRYDALNRPVQIVSPHTVLDTGETPPNAILPNVIQPRYNEANLLDSVAVWVRQEQTPQEDEPLLEPDTASYQAVRDISYDAKGQRLRIKYGNGAWTTYDYDRETFRLTHLFTARYGLDVPDDTPPRPAKGLQNLRYTYDPVGNITHIRDEAQQTVYFKNAKVDPQNEYTYDAIYRLVTATGREHRGQVGSCQWQALKPKYDWDDCPRTNQGHPNDSENMRNYKRDYLYDEVGNIMSMTRSTDGDVWTRYYAYQEASQLTEEIEETASTGEQGGTQAIFSNRLSRTSLPGDDPMGPYHAVYHYDDHGNMTKMPHLQLMQWDYRDQLQATAKQHTSEEQEPEITWYVYDASGQRVRKVTDWQYGNGQAPRRKCERIYLDGFEIYRTYNGNGEKVTLERECLHVMDDQKRVALIETKTKEEASLLKRLRRVFNANSSLIRYQFGNHLGSSSLELDDEGETISYEEYYPYGSTSYQGVNKQIKATNKRYRYTGKEQDEESGFYYYGARYYVPWLARWGNPDPLGLADGSNLYSFTQNNPITQLDDDGMRTIKFDVGFGSSPLLKEATKLMLVRMQNELRDYFGIPTDIDTSKMTISLVDEPHQQQAADADLNDRIFSELYGVYSTTNSSKTVLPLDTKERLTKQRELFGEAKKAGEKIKDILFKENIEFDVAIKQPWPNHAQALEGGLYKPIFGTSNFYVNPFYWHVREAEMFVPSMYASSKPAYIRMGPTLLLTHEIIHKIQGVKGSEAYAGHDTFVENEAVKKMDALVKNVHGIAQRVNYSGEEEKPEENTRSRLHMSGGRVGRSPL